VLLTQYGTNPCAGGGEEIVGNRHITWRDLRDDRAAWSCRGRKIGGCVQAVFKRLQFQLTGKRLLPNELLLAPEGVVPLLGLQILGPCLSAEDQSQDQPARPNDGQP